MYCYKRYISILTLHIIVLKLVPSSVGSEHLLQLHLKYFVDIRYACLSRVPHSAFVYMILRCSPL